MQGYYLECRSVTTAQRAARALDRCGYPARVTRLPSGVAGGCGYAVRIRPHMASDARECLRREGIEVGRLIRLEVSGP